MTEARTYMDGYSDGKEWAQADMLRTIKELQASLAWITEYIRAAPPELEEAKKWLLVMDNASAGASPVEPSQAQPPAPSEAAREYMTGYSDCKEWAGATSQAQPSQYGSPESHGQTAYKMAKALADHLAVTPVEPNQALSLDLLERLSKTLTRLGYATPEGGMEHFNADLANQLYNLCRAVDSLFDREQPSACEAMTPIVTKVPAGWQSIGTAPKDNTRLLYLARFDDEGALIELDYDGIWEYWSESYEMPHINGWTWMSANGIEEPTHWCYQEEHLAPAPSDTAITYMTGYSDAKEWAAATQPKEPK